MNETKSRHESSTSIVTPAKRTKGREPFVPRKLDFRPSNERRGAIKAEQNEYNFLPSFPRCSKARTTFYAEKSENHEQKFNRLWKLQHGRGHTFEGWDGERVRQEDRFTYRRACVMLSQADVSGWVRDEVLSKVVRENLNGFSRYYRGVDGAALGFACLYKYENQERAEDSYIAGTVEGLLDVDAGKLIDYIWRKYKGDNDG